MKEFDMLYFIKTKNFCSEKVYSAKDTVKENEDKPQNGKNNCQEKHLRKGLLPKYTNNSKKKKTTGFKNESVIWTRHQKIYIQTANEYIKRSTSICLTAN